MSRLLDRSPRPVVPAPAFNAFGGHEYVAAWAHEDVMMRLSAVRESRGCVHAEVAVIYDGRQLQLDRIDLVGTGSREALVRKLDQTTREVPWRPMLEEACRLTIAAARRGEPLVPLTGIVTSPTRELMPGLLYEGEPSLLYADGDTGKSLVALTIGVAVCAGVALPFGLKPARAMPVMYLDYEASQSTMDERHGKIAAGLGIDPPPILYKHMNRPLVDEAPTLAAEIARRRVGLVVIDSKMFAVASGEGAMYHEPIVAFYNALRSFAPAATLVLNHVTNESAKNGTPARPFGGAYAFNGPRLAWEAKRDRDVDDATAIVFTCKKANNLARKPDPFGLLFRPGDGTITVYPFSLNEAAPQTVVGASITYRLRLALAAGPTTPATLAEQLDQDEATVKRLLRRLRQDGVVKDRPDGSWEMVPRC